MFSLLVACSDRSNSTAGCILPIAVDDDVAWRLYSLLIFTGMLLVVVVVWLSSRAHQARERVRERWRVHLEDVKSLVFM